MIYDLYWINDESGGGVIVGDADGLVVVYQNDYDDRLRVQNQWVVIVMFNRLQSIGLFKFIDMDGTNLMESDSKSENMGFK